MRVVVTAAALALLAGCASTPPTQSPAHTGSWRVVPLSGASNFPDRCALLVNEQTGDTWVYNSADQWTPVKRP